MVDKVIGELPGISSLDATSLFVAEQSGQAVKVSGKQLTDFSNVETNAQVEQAKASAQAAKTAQDAAEAAILKGPIIQNGTWWVYNQTAGAYQDTGIKATGPQGIPGPTSSVNGISPDDSGNIVLTAGNVNAYSKTEADTLLAGKAPAGYGLGTTGASINSGKDLNDIWQCGFYSWGSGVSNAPFGYGLMVVLSPGAYADGRVQIAYDRVNKTIAIRWLNTTWSTWEYQNPPMVVGKEYRTTERYQGNPVYTMMCPSVALGSAGSTAYIEGLANIKDIIDYCIQFQYSNGQTFAVNNWSKVKVATHYDSGYAYASIDCIEDCSNNKAIGTFKYTKTTD